MNIRLTPRQLNVLKTLAGEAGLRPGELVTAWVEERLEAERTGAGPKAQSALAARVDELAARIAALESGSSATAPAPSAGGAPADVVTPKRRGRPPKSAAIAAADDAAPAQPPKKRGRPRKAAMPAASGKRVPLHQEIIAVISERGPQTAAELAAAITERGVFRAPRSGKPLDAATVNSRVSNPVYRALFRREGHRVALADG